MNLIYDPLNLLETTQNPMTVTGLYKKRINSNTKGRKNENKTKEWFKEKNCVVQNTIRAPYRKGQSYGSNNNDFFGLYDHVVIARNDFYVNADYIPAIARIIKKQGIPINNDYIINAKDTVFVQTKSNELPGPAYFKNKGFANNPARHKFLFVWKDRNKIPKIYRLDYLELLEK